MAIPLGRYRSAGLDTSRMTFEKGRSTALGVAQGIIGAGLKNAQASADQISRGLRSAQAGRTQEGRETQQETTRQRRQVTAPPKPYETPPSVQQRQAPGIAKGRITAVEQFLREEGLPVDELTPELKQQFAYATDDQVMAAVNSRNLGELVMEKGSPTGGATNLSNAALISSASRNVSSIGDVRLGRFGRTTGGPTLGESFAEVNQRFFEPTELVGGRVIETISETGKGGGIIRGKGRKAFKQESGQLPGDVSAATKSIIGGDKERAELVERLDTLGIESRIIGGIIFDPLNLVPGLGFTHVEDFADGIRAFRKGGRALKNSPNGQKFVSGLRRLNAEEIGGTKYTPQEPGGPTPDELAFGATGDAQSSFRQSVRDYQEAVQRGASEEELARLATRSAEAKNKYLTLGRPPGELRPVQPEEAPGGVTPDELAFGGQRGPSAVPSAEAAELARERAKILEEVRASSITDPVNEQRFARVSEIDDYLDSIGQGYMQGQRPGTLRQGPTPDELAFGPKASSVESLGMRQPEDALNYKTDYSIVPTENLENRIKLIDQSINAPNLSVGERNHMMAEQRDVLEELRRRQPELGPGTPQGPSRGIEETGIPGEVPPIEEAIPPGEIPEPTIPKPSGPIRIEARTILLEPDAIKVDIRTSETPTLSGARNAKEALINDLGALLDANPHVNRIRMDVVKDSLWERLERIGLVSHEEVLGRRGNVIGKKFVITRDDAAKLLGKATPAERNALIRDLKAVLAGKKKASPMPRKRGQYVGPALRRTLREAGFTREEIERLSHLPPISGGAEGVSKEAQEALRKLNAPKGPPSFTEPQTPPRFGGEQSPPVFDAPQEGIPPQYPEEDSAAKAVEDAFTAGTMSRENADMILDRLDPLANRSATQPRLLPGFDDPAVQTLLDRAQHDATLIPITEPLLKAGKPRRMVAGVVSAIRGTPVGVIGQLAEQRFILKEALHQHGVEDALTTKIADNFLQDEVIRRFGVKTPRPGYSKLFRGYHAPDEIVHWVEMTRRPVGNIGKQVEDVAGTFKNTVFGALDIAVTGVQFPLALAQGGFQLGIGTLNRSLEMLSLPHFNTLLHDPDFISRSAQYASQGGLHEGIGPSSIQLKTGTLLKYIPVAGKYVDAPVRWWIDKLTEVNFGIALGAIRNRMYEGNLIALKIIGEDTTKTKTLRQAGDWSNAMTGASLGAQVTGRRVGEAVALTSFQMARSQLAVYGQVAKAVLNPMSSKTDKLRAALTLANMAAYVYGLQWVVNKQFGNGPMEWQPGKPDWATIKVRGYTIPIIPNKSLLRAVDRSIEYLAKGDEQDIPRVWGQLVISRGSPLAQIPASGAGFGYEPGTGSFKAGTLSQKGRAVGALPLPPMAETAAFESTDPTNLGASVLGFNAYKPTVGQTLYDIPQFTGIDNDTVREIRGNEGFMDRVRASRLHMADVQGQQAVEDFPSVKSIVTQGLQEGQTAEFIKAAMILSKPKEALKLTNPEWLWYVYNNKEQLQKERPEIFDIELHDILNKIEARKAVGQ